MAKECNSKTCDKSSCEGCSSKGTNMDLMAEANSMSNVKHVIGIVSGKGGVGKSFVTASLANRMAAKGFKVGILDADITGPSIPKMYGLKGAAPVSYTPLDVDFDLFGEQNIRSITVSGIRCQDMRLRLKYVDIPSVLEPDVEKAIRDRVKDGTGNLYVLVNYTALFATRNILKKLEGEQK